MSSSLKDTQAFFAVRAVGWEARFPDDEPRYKQAINEMLSRAVVRVLDVGCGTGRAIPFLRQKAKHVVALDVTAEMLAEVRRLGRGEAARLVQADGSRLPFGDASFEAIFAAGFVPHLQDPRAGLAELARVTAPGGCLAIFHPIGRAALAARHGGAPSDDDITSPARLPGLLDDAGWRLESLDDSADRYLALATRT